MSGVLGIGVPTLDIYPKQKRMYPGGNEYNVVCNVKKHGLRAGFLGVFGNDKAGKILEDTLKQMDVDVSFCHHEIGSSGYSIVELKEDGDRIFLEWNQKGVADLYPILVDTQEELEYVKSFDVLSIGRLCNLPKDRIQFLKENGVSICYDFHATFSDKTIKEIAPFIDYAFFSCSHLNESEIKDTLKFAIEHGCKIAIGTRGKEDVICFDGKQFYRQPTQNVHVLDALGAGDSYIASFLSNYIQSQDIPLSLYKATLHSAKVVQIEGSIGIGYDIDFDDIKDIVNK